MSASTVKSSASIITVGGRTGRPLDKWPDGSPSVRAGTPDPYMCALRNVDEASIEASDEAHSEGRGVRALAQARRQFGFTRELSRRAVRRARIQALLLAPMVVGVLLLYKYR